MADRAGCKSRALLISWGDFLERAERALVRRALTGADLAMVAVGMAEVTGSRSADDALRGVVAELILAGPGPGDAVAVAGSGPDWVQA